MPADLFKEKNLIEQYLQMEAHELSAYSFVNIFLWKDFFDFDLKIIDNHLCIFAENTIGCFLYLPPLGKGFSAHAAQECFNIMATKNKGSSVSRIENVPEGMCASFSSSRHSFFKKSDEYVYRREDIASLRGNTYKAKRAAYNQFVKNNRFEFLSYRKDMLRECTALYKRWADFKAKSNKGEVYRQMLEENERVHELALNHHQSLGLVGRVVFIDGKIRAYSFGYTLTEDTFCILFEIADTEIKGLPTGIFKEFCNHVGLKKFNFINVMDDFGLENIRATKLSFRPYRTVSSFVVSRKKSHGAA